MIIEKATLTTGSFNFSKAAEESNAENLLILKGNKTRRTDILPTVIILTFGPPPQPSPAGGGSIMKAQITPVLSIYPEL